MLRIYDSLDAVPEAQREHYKLIEGKYVPEVSDDHPVKVNNVKLLNEKNAAETRASGLESANTSLKADLESAKGSSVPRGHVVVTKAEAESLAAVKEHGTATEIAAKLAEHKALKEESTKRARQDSLRAVAKELNYNPDAFVLLPDLPEFEKREKDGKTAYIAKVKEGENFVEKPAKDFIEGAEHLAPLLPALKVQSSGVPAPSEKSDRGVPVGNVFDKIRENAKAEQAAKPPVDAVAQRFGVSKTA